MAPETTYQCFPGHSMPDVIHFSGVDFFAVCACVVCHTSKINTNMLEYNAYFCVVCRRMETAVALRQSPTRPLHRQPSASRRRQRRRRCASLRTAPILRSGCPRAAERRHLAAASVRAAMMWTLHWRPSLRS